MSEERAAVIERLERAREARMWGKITLTLRDGRVTIVEVSSTHPIGRTEVERAEDVHG